VIDESAPPIANEALLTVPNTAFHSVGTWESSSFASVLRSSPSSSYTRSFVRPDKSRHRGLKTETNDLDVAWHELEQRNPRGVKTRNNRFAVLGGDGRRRR